MSNSVAIIVTWNVFSVHSGSGVLRFHYPGGVVVSSERLQLWQVHCQLNPGECVCVSIMCIGQQREDHTDVET